VTNRISSLPSSRRAALIAGVGYLVIFVLAIFANFFVLDTLAHSLLANYAAHETVFLLIVAVPSFAGELWFVGRLLARGGEQPPPAARAIDDTDGDLLVRSQ
jgi:hypothetical protein